METILDDLSLNLLWSWNHYGDKVWQALDSDLWALTRNPRAILQTISKEKLKKKLADPEFKKVIDHLREVNKLKTEGPSWFGQTHPHTSLTTVAYFCMEYMLSEALPIYSGGLGNVAGDQLKTASDLAVPVVAIGLLYQQGYFRQTIDQEGNQQAFFPFNDTRQLPISPLRNSGGEWIRFQIPLPGCSVWLRAWEVKVGRAKLYLLDSNDLANYPPHRGITSELYGGGPEQRLKQEWILGIGGYRLLTLLGIKPEVCHLNECHAAFVVLERARQWMQEANVSFQEAFSVTRLGNLFTTHTPVPAGFDRFSPDMMKTYLEKYATDELGISLQELLALGRQNPQDPQEYFNMAYLALRGSQAANGVSQLHGKVSRHLFAPLFPGVKEEDVPIGHVTNGVHMPSWDSMEADTLWTESCGKGRWMDGECSLEKMEKVPVEAIWKMRNDARNTLVEFVGKAKSREIKEEEADRLFDPNVLTMGFARRFAAYKRPDMLLQDPDRLLRILNNPQRPVQLIVAGKAHPADEEGKALIRKWIDFIKHPLAKGKVVFLADYDVLLTEQLVQGVDLWINTPRRPWEACGTSGMKVLVNGGINLSELDGWWAEAYTPEVGWALGDGQEHDPSYDSTEGYNLYTLLENEIIPLFYKRNAQNLPVEWLEKVRNSMAHLTPQFSAARTVREYTEKYYLPLAEKYKLCIEGVGSQK